MWHVRRGRVPRARCAARGMPDTWLGPEARVLVSKVSGITASAPPSAPLPPAIRPLDPSHPTPPHPTPPPLSCAPERSSRVESSRVECAAVDEWVQPQAECASASTSRVSCAARVAWRRCFRYDVARGLVLVALLSPRVAHSRALSALPHAPCALCAHCSLAVASAVPVAPRLFSSSARRSSSRHSELIALAAATDAIVAPDSSLLIARAC